MQTKVKSSVSGKEQESATLYVKEKEYLKHRYKYDHDTQNEIIIICFDGTKVDLQLYKSFESQRLIGVLPDNRYIQNAINNNRFEPKDDLTPYDIYSANHCDMRHLLIYWDKELIHKDVDGFIVLRDHLHCYVFREGVYNTQTHHLAPPFVALQKYVGLSRNQAYHLCNFFLMKVEKSAVRQYCHKHYANFDIDIPPSLDAPLNYLKDDNILESDSASKTSLFSVLKDACYIDESAILDMLQYGQFSMDSKHNICFNTVDESGNIISSYKMSRYKHGFDDFSYNHYVTRRNVGFEYLSLGALKKEWEKSDSLTAVTVFEDPIELMSYLALEKLGRVEKLSNVSHFLALNGSNTNVLNDFLKRHKEVKTVNVAIKGNYINNVFISKQLVRDAKKLCVTTINMTNDLLFEETCKVTFNGDGEIGIHGWNDLLKHHKGIKI